MAFEQFKTDRVGARRIMLPYVTLRMNGQSYISSEAVKRHNLMNYGFCHLYYDREKSLIGFKLFELGTVNALRLVPAGAGVPGFLISMSSFFKHYNIDPKTLPHPPRFYLQKSTEEQALFFIDLKKPLGSKKDEAQTV